MVRKLVLFAAVALFPGCATTLSSFQTGDVTDFKQAQVIGGAGLYLPLGPVGTIVKQGIEQADAIKKANDSGEPYALTEEDQQELLTAGVALAVMPPSFSPNYEIGVRTGIWDQKMDLGLRYSVNAIRLDTKYQILHQGDGINIEPHKRNSFDLAVGAGVSKYLFDNPVLDVLDYVKLADFDRWDFEGAVYASLDRGNIIKVYGGAKYVFSYTTIDANLVNYSLHASNVSGWDVSLPSKVPMHFIGGTGGVMAGYRWVHVALEMTGGYTICNPVLFGQRRQLGGPTFYPAVGIIVTVP